MLAVVFLDLALFWNAVVRRKLSDFQSYYNRHRTHSSLDGDTPAEVSQSASKLPIKLDNFLWQTHSKGLSQLPFAALEYEFSIDAVSGPVTCVHDAVMRQRENIDRCRFHASLLALGKRD